MGEFTTSDGLRLYFEDTGKGQTLVCLAGLTRNCRDFDYLAPHLSETRLITLDYRGRGRSQYDPAWANYNVMREAQDVIELLDHLGLSQTTLLGTSRGGLIAMVLAAGHADRLSGVILNDVGPVVSAGGIVRIMDYVGKPPAWATHALAADGLKAAMGAEFPDLSDVTWLQMAQAQYHETANGLTVSYDEHLRDALLAQIAAAPPPDLWPLFDALIPLPTGVLRGANSDILEPETLSEMQRCHPNMISATVPDRGHVPLLNEPLSLTLIRQILELTK
jgi:pimeloyl-ACP methyl ester carboxylesterase